jgi:hypothetical protein
LVVVQYLTIASAGNRPIPTKNAMLAKLAVAAVFRTVPEKQSG